MHTFMLSVSRASSPLRMVSTPLLPLLVRGLGCRPTPALPLLLRGLGVLHFPKKFRPPPMVSHPCPVRKPLPCSKSGNLRSSFPHQT